MIHDFGSRHSIPHIWQVYFETVCKLSVNKDESGLNVKVTSKKAPRWRKYN